ncbi:MAG TPA: ubiquinone/menaquinone biosynthesis methyltransferase [Blastocatellia bacterium]|nr:ubiquinone/menaquinone biosynthesis methyltransferase [Blastocatellia bacterium]HMV84568.1 ubiquinone/menaquinone biosynthesis methyltransferase [Blastocatellia bacterium]HMX26822.1 ubiquinone/menaquinone biosynthesis methyltransferase [Blastocatellia bacterium]HMZ18157.1 ubiquinone/menaquinone biosynthesis methyltransferase [Blastocatellia bacterium]HNG32675.1 ubiquinone/menaquinone biosynthesis methyltransferase [Blastocatellia bacterium]
MENLNLEEHISSKQKKQNYVTQMFEIIAPRYDFFTVLFSYGMDRGWKRKLIEMLNLKGDEQVLDLACGTGDITFALGEKLPAGNATGLDITSGMIEIANHKRREKNVPNVSFQLGDIMSMPFPDASFDYVTCGYALRNVPDVEAALSEIRRVLKPGGRLLSLDFAHPNNRIYRWLYINYLIVVGSAAGILMHGDADIYRYIPESLKRYPGQHGVRDLMTRQGFAGAGFIEFGGGIMAINYGTKPR